MDRVLTRWIAGCALAEAVGMTAAAAAARAGDRWVGTPGTTAGTAMLVGLAVAGGVVEALALGTATGIALRASAPTLPLARWTAVTTAVAGLSWAAGSVPAALSGDGDAAASGTPALWLIALGAAVIGLATGGLLGVAQCLVLRGRVRHPWRWVTASCLAWPLPMAVIFVGATVPDRTWSTGSVLALALPVGAVAGALLGAVLGACAPTLSGASVRDTAVLRLLRSPSGRAVLPGMVGLAVRGRSTGVRYELPVSAVEDEAGLVVLVGHAARKTWWRNLRSPAEIGLLRDGAWQQATARVVAPDDPAHAPAARAYLGRHPRAAAAGDAVLVRIHPGDLPQGGPRRPTVSGRATAAGSPR